MKIEDLDQLPASSRLVSKVSELGIGIISPGDTLADTVTVREDVTTFQPGILPIGLAQLQEMCWAEERPRFDSKALPLIRKEVETFLKVHAEKTLGRINDRGQKVYDEWGLLNPENLFVLLSLLSKIADKKEETTDLDEKTRILTLGTGSGLTDVAMFNLLSNFDIDFTIDTVDFRKDENGERKEQFTLIPLDKRNKGYGPVAKRGIGHAIEKIHKTAVLGEIIQHHQDSANFLIKAVNQKKRFDFVFIDANHQFDSVFFDISEVYRLMNPGGIIFLDDFGGSKLATNGGVTMAAYVHAAATRQFGYYVSNSFEDPFTTNTAFFIKSKLTEVDDNFNISRRR